MDLQVPAGLTDQEARLTHREREVLSLILAARTTREITTELCITRGTAKNYLTSIYRKLGVSGRSEIRDRVADLHPLDIHFGSDVAHEEQIR